MPKRRLLWHLFPSYGLLVAAAALLFGWAAVRVLGGALLDSTRNELTELADFLDAQLGPEVPADRSEFTRLTRRLDQATQVRITLLRPDGQVDTDSRGRPEEFENQRTRPELDAAFKKRPASAIRYNTGLESRVLYQAVPVMRHDELFGVFYLSKPLASVDRAIQRLQLWFVGIGLALGGGAVLLAWRSAQQLSRPLVQLRAALDRFADEYWGARVVLPDDRETAELVETFNRTADHLQQRIGILTRHNNEQKAVLASMAEGVLAVDNQERIISLNRASSRLLGLDQQHVQGRRLQEVVRNADLSRFVNRALASAVPIQADLVLLGERERVMQAHGAALHDVDGRQFGAVIVLNDITDFRKLELIRRDFVANVSHELKTPVTSIKGFVETLLDGAKESPVDSDRFLRIIARQADRLHAIIEDLLALSKIEQSEDSEDLMLERSRIRPLLESAQTTCLTVAQERQIEVQIECEPDLKAQINPLLLEQAIVNLLDNAIKYSEPNREVRVAAADAGDEVRISVIDRGPGIAEEHLSRIFERFYRVDRARSRKLGGTGLGLAIVKHIAQAHHGRVTVTSTVGYGSTFTIHLPK